MHIQGQNRDQGTLLPEWLDDLIAEDNAVRVIDAFVDTLNLKALGFARIEVEATGRPPYHPGDLLKLYLYGYMHQVRSSRRLERVALTERIQAMDDAGISAQPDTDPETRVMRHGRIGYNVQSTVDGK